MGWLLPALLAAAGSPARPQVYALVVGNNRPVDEGTVELHYADDDALALQALLLDAGVRSLLLTRLDRETAALHSADRVDPPTVTNLKAAWRRLRDDMLAAAGRGEAVEFLFFFSGHGEVSFGEGSLSLEEGALTRAGLQEMLESSPARRNHVIIDACKAYFAVLGKGPGGTRAPYRTVPGDGVFARTGFLLSTSSDGDSHEWERYQAGVFSFEVRAALRGSADANGDGVLTYAELGGFLTLANAGLSPRFRPDFLVAPPGGRAADLDEPLLRWPAQTAALEVDGSAQHLYVESSSGQRLLELHRAASQRLLLHLPKERPLFVRSADEREEWLLDAPGDAQLSMLVLSSPAVSKKGALQIAFRNLFAKPFDLAAVEAFSKDYWQRHDDPRHLAPGWKSTVRVAAPIVAGAAVVVGLVGLGIGLERAQIAPATSQLERVQRNLGIQTANIVMGIASGVALSALATWAVFSFFSPSTQVQAVLMPTGVAVAGSW